MLKTEDTCLVLVDVQGRLARAMTDAEALFDQLTRLVRGAQALNIPIVWMEQLPSKLGRTIQPLRRLLCDEAPIEKTCFSCWLSPEFRQRLDDIEPRHVLIAGIEAHVCVYQTAMDLIDHAYDVHVVTDAVSSRTTANRDMALCKMDRMGALLTSVECALFEMARTAEHPAFRDLSRIVK